MLRAHTPQLAPIRQAARAVQRAIILQLLAQHHVQAVVRALRRFLERQNVITQWGQRSMRLRFLHRHSPTA